jgi:hypothetical protein
LGAWVTVIERAGDGEDVARVVVDHQDSPAPQRFVPRGLPGGPGRSAQRLADQRGDLVGLRSRQVQRDPLAQLVE